MRFDSYWRWLNGGVSFFSGSTITSRFAVVSPKIVGFNPNCSLVWLKCSSRKWSLIVRGHILVGVGRVRGYETNNEVRFLLALALVGSFLFLVLN